MKTWMRLERLAMVALFGGFCLAIAYSTINEEFQDMLFWNSRTYHYANALHLYCGTGGPCDSLEWSTHEAKDKSSNALVLDWRGGQLTARDLEDEEGLRARGWRTVLAYQNVVELESRAYQGEPAPYAKVTLTDGALSRVLVRSGEPVSFSAQGKRYTLPVPRTGVERAWGTPLTTDRANAINGKIPD